MAGEFSGGGRPQRSLALLWGAQKPPTRGPKPALSVERVVRAGIEVADADGLEALSMRRVAERLGVGTMSLYRYVPAKGELLDLMLDAVFGERSAPPSGGWREQLEHFAREGMALYRRHPWVLQVSLARPPLGPNTVGNFDAMLRALAGTGLSGPDIVAAVTLVGSYLRGAAHASVDPARAERATGESTEAWWTARRSFWDEYFDEQRFPGITRAWEQGGFEEGRDDFEFGLARVLDGIETYLGRS